MNTCIPPFYCFTHYYYYWKKIKFWTKHTSVPNNIFLPIHQTTCVYPCTAQISCDIMHIVDQHSKYCMDDATYNMTPTLMLNAKLCDVTLSLIKFSRTGG